MSTGRELEDLQEKLPPYLRNLSSDDADVLVWHVLLLPEEPPYNLKAFHLRINFPENYPFKPPTVTFTTRIYHPNVGHNGSVCLPIISRENWKPHTKTCQVTGHLQAGWQEMSPEGNQNPRRAQASGGRGHVGSMHGRLGHSESYLQLSNLFIE
ncbi:ubiquitin/ISG15-conjugating enzyme E2 L6 isoform X2 [Mirounga angustirostris]|uniref:ubiquitin/ISG15-conjugating enzyme E2 L6 isoform X2 n=1 Tax=Mirounga angustirostris TaxID=9716 RepID=UPI00313C3286